MLKVIKVKVEPLTAEAFETFGQAIETFDEAENEYTVTRTSPTPRRINSLSEGRLRAHFACYDDG